MYPLAHLTDSPRKSISVRKAIASGLAPPIDAKIKFFLEITTLFFKPFPFFDILSLTYSCRMKRILIPRTPHSNQPLHYF